MKTKSFCQWYLKETTIQIRYTENIPQNKHEFMEKKEESNIRRNKMKLDAS